MLLGKCISDFASNLNPGKNSDSFVSFRTAGAGPGDVESLVTIPIEDSIDSLEKVKTVASRSQENVSIITIEFG